LVEQHGEEAVLIAGCAVLGYPGTWAHAYKEAAAIKAAINS